MIPSIFISHGPPFIALIDEPATRFLKDLSNILPRPKAIISISAHWEALYPKVSGAEKPEIIYDFSGPSQLFDLKYNISGSPELVEKVVTTLSNKGFNTENDLNRGFDHGTWIPLLLMYPEGDIPVIQISIETEENTDYHFRLGKALSQFRNEGVLIMASGGAVHNLYEMQNYSMHSDPPGYIKSFDEWLEKAITDGNITALTNYKKEAPYPEKCHPYPAEHFLPMFVALGANTDIKGQQLHKSFLYGTLSMAAYAWN